MGSGRRLRAAITLLALVNMLPAVEADASWSLFGAAAVAALLSIALAMPNGESRMPGPVLYFFVFAALSFLVFEMFLDGPSVYVLDLAHFMTLLCACKFFEMRSNRDIGLIAIMSGLILIIAALVSGSVLFGMAVTINITLGVWWLIAFHIRSESDAIIRRRHAAFDAAGATFAPASPSAGRAAELPLRADLDTTLKRGARFPGAVVVCSAGLVLVGSMLFVAVPRSWGQSWFGQLRQRFSASVTGFTSEVELGDARIAESNVLVMRVRFLQDGESIGGEGFRPYLRGATMDRYEGGRWRKPVGRIPETHTLRRGDRVGLTRIRGLVPDDQIIEQQVWLDRAGPQLFCLFPPIAFESADMIHVQHNRLDRVLNSRDPSGPEIHYTVESAAQVSFAAASMMEEEPVRRGRSQRARSRQDRIPPAIRRFAAELAPRFGDPAEPGDLLKIVRGIEAYLSGDEFEYTLDRRGHERGLGEDPVENFLFKSKRGHCEYFASAMTLLCQSLDMRARLVSGYYGGAYNEIGEGFYQFKEKDAHAWVEVWIPEQGWMTFDPSPSSAEDTSQAAAGLLARLQATVEYMQFRWSVFVVAFDVQVRDELVGGFGEWFNKLGEEGGGPGFHWSTVTQILWGPELLTLGQRAGYWFFLVLCVAFVVLLGRIGWILSLRVREYLPQRAGPTIQRLPAAKFYDRLLLLLANKGHPKPPAHTPREFARRLAETHVDLAEVTTLTEWFYEAQYGNSEPDRDRRIQTAEFLTRLREDPSFGVR